MSPALFVSTPELMIVCDVPVVHDRQIGIPVAPKRLRMTQVDARFGRQPGVADPVAAAHAGNAVGGLDIAWRSYLLHDIERSAHTDNFKIRVERFDSLYHLLHVRFIVDKEAGIG